MTYYRQIVAQIHRFGQKAAVEVRSDASQNEFGNIESQWTPDRTVIAFRTYPNRQTEVEASRGDRAQDNPVFLIPNTDDQPDPPETSDILVYDGTRYEMKAPTSYETHVEIFGEVVSNPQ